MPKLVLTAFDLTAPGVAEVLQLALDYRRSVDAAVSSLRLQAGTDDLWAAIRAGSLPRRGRLTTPRGRYAFHGIGCRFDIARRTVDVDFGPDGRHDGFDAWRLDLYAKSAFEWQHISADQVASGLAKLLSDGLVYQPRWEPSPHLLYLAL